MHILAKDLRFGVEIECYLPRDCAGDIPNNGSAIALGPHGWIGEADGSLGYSCPAGFYGAEVVSPVLHGEQGLIEVWYMIDYLRSLGAVVNEACGLHIHYDARTLTERDVQRVKAAWVKYEMMFFGLNGDAIARRLQSTYCAHSLRWGLQGGWGAIRYQSLNRVNFRPGATRGKCTLEVRVYEGTLDPRSVYTMVYLGAALVAKALRDEDAVADGRYAEPRAALEAFLTAHMTDSRNVIVPIADSDDVVEHANALITQADSYLRRNRRRLGL